MYCLATHPDVQDKLQEEVRNLYAESSEPSFDAIWALPYLNNFVREVLRLLCPGTYPFLGTLYPPSHMLMVDDLAPPTAYYSIREAAEDVVIEGVAIPKGTQVDVMLHAIHRSREIWGDDADEFRPDRWDALTGDANNNFAFEAFLQGPRICPGRHFAMIGIKTSLVELVRQWHFVGIEKNDGSGVLLANGDEKLGRGVSNCSPCSLLSSQPIIYPVKTIIPSTQRPNFHLTLTRYRCGSRLWPSS